MKQRQVMTILYGEREICGLLVKAIVDLFSCYSEREQISVKLSKIYCRNLLSVECYDRRRLAGCRLWACEQTSLVYFCVYKVKKLSRFQAFMDPLDDRMCTFVQLNFSRLPHHPGHQYLRRTCRAKPG